MSTRLARRGFLLAGGLGAVLPALPTAAATATTALTAAEYAIVAALVGRIVPADRSPSALALGSADYVAAGLLARSADGGGAVSQGLAAVDALALQTFGIGFAALDAARQTALTEVVATEAAFAPLWGGIRALTVLHYYAQPAAYLDIGLPGPSVDSGGHPDPDSVPCRAPSAG
ncbi:gluconate 2-dehydrogenase subunit 3 family protein [Derxia lacustris]|uniref:gluconate 2-dehydrogenase subunit 3 family protein n=1 Tax=Derxia lacustris TaxID=764842 RepID=UPI001592DE09|nr:gluconate 2-dehydrogenase subunit 3 family protein [Derxia lacustris]